MSIFHISPVNPLILGGGCRARLKAMDSGSDLLLQALLTQLSNNYDPTISFPKFAKLSEKICFLEFSKVSFSMECDYGNLGLSN